MKAIDIVIRDISGQSELRETEELQKVVWGIPDIEVVPISQMVAAQAAGGCLLGAFDSGILVGFSYGFVSYEKGQMAHHSHMLAVKPEYRNCKLGEKLKRAQREFVLRQGISMMSWTFDPLQSLNAYFNFNKLGVVSDQYFVNFYGEDAPSFLHQNDTDRLWVIWNLKEENKVSSIEIEKVKRLVRLSENDIPQLFDSSEEDKKVAIEIPADINELVKRNSDLAKKWREFTRKAFVNALEKGFTITDFFRGKRGNSEFGVYLLERKKST